MKNYVYSEANSLFFNCLSVLLVCDLVRKLLERFTCGEQNDCLKLTVRIFIVHYSEQYTVQIDKI